MYKYSHSECTSTVSWVTKWSLDASDFSVGDLLPSSTRCSALCANRSVCMRRSCGIGWSRFLDGLKKETKDNRTQVNKWLKRCCCFVFVFFKQTLDMSTFLAICLPPFLCSFNDVFMLGDLNVISFSFLLFLTFSVIKFVSFIWCQLFCLPD